MNTVASTYPPEIHVARGTSAFQTDYGNSSSSTGQIFLRPRKVTAKTEQSFSRVKSKFFDLRSLGRFGRKITSDTKGDFDQNSSFADIEALFGEFVDFDTAQTVSRRSSNRPAVESTHFGLFRNDLEEIDEQSSSLLKSAIEYGDDSAIDHIRAALSSSRLSASYMTSICEVLGRSQSIISRNRSLTLMLELLANPAPHVRDSALIGLALLDDKRAIPRLTELVAIETNRLIHEAAVEVISQLSEHA